MVMSMSEKKKFTVYLPCVYSEIYHVEAETAAEALALVQAQQAHCIGEASTGKEDQGTRVVKGFQ